MTARHTVEIAVRWSESDPAGIAFYPRFFEWFDITCDALFTSLGMPWAELFPRHAIVGVSIVECGARFASPVRYGETLTITATVAWVKEKTFRVDYDVAVKDRHCASGFEVRAWVARPTAPGEALRARPIPPEVVTKLEGAS